MKLLKRKIPFFLYFAITIYSCTDTKHKEVCPNSVTIDIGKAEECCISEFIDKIDYITLKCPRGEVLGGRGSLKIGEKHIYFCDNMQRALFVFDMNGNFIAKLDKLGRGSGEYLMISEFYPSENEKVIEIIDGVGGNIITYENFSFKFINQIPIVDRVAFNLAVKVDDENYLLSTNRNQNSYNGKRTNADFFLSRKGKIVKSFFDKKIKRENAQFSIFTENLTVNDSNKIFASVDFDNTIYQFKNNAFHPYLEVIYKNGKSLNRKISDMTMKQQAEYFLSDDFLRTASYPVMPLNNKKLMVLNYMYREKKGQNLTASYRHYIYLKDNNMEINAKSLINDITDFPKEVYISTMSKGSLIDHHPMYKNYLVDIISPAHELAPGDNIVLKGGEKVDFNDNPIVMLMRLKY